MTVIYAYDNEVEKYQKQYDGILEELNPLYAEMTLIKNKIAEAEFRKSHIQCLLAQAKKSRGMEVSPESAYCFTKLH